MKVIQEYLSAFFDLFVPRIDPKNPEVEPLVRSWESMVLPIVIAICLMISITLT